MKICGKRVAEFKIQEGLDIINGDKRVLFGEKVDLRTPDCLAYKEANKKGKIKCLCCGLEASHFGLNKNDNGLSMALYGLDSFGREIKFSKGLDVFIGSKKVICASCIKNVSAWKKEVNKDYELA